MKFWSIFVIGLMTVCVVVGSPGCPAVAQAQQASKISLADFFALIKSTDLIDSSQDFVEKKLGPGTAAVAKSSDTKSGDVKSLCLQYPVSDPVITAIEIEYRDGKVRQWRLAGHASDATAKSQTGASTEAIRKSAWVTTNVERYSIPKQSTLVAVAKKTDPKQEPTLLVLLSDQPTARELLEAAKACRIGFFLKQADNFARQSVFKAQSNEDTKNSAFYLKFRLPSHPADWDVERRHAEAYAKESTDLDEAAALYEKNIAEDPNFEFSYYTLAKLKQIKGDYDGAAKLLDAVLKVNPQYQRALFELAKVQLLQGSVTKAIETAKKAYALYPDDLESKNTLALIEQLGSVVDHKSTAQFEKVPKKFYLVASGQKRVWTRLAPFLWIEEQPDGLKLTYWAMSTSDEKGSGKNKTALRHGTVLRRDDSIIDVFVPDPGSDPGVGYRYPGTSTWGPWADMNVEK
jgi:tetratricopeptide (TPR) repeat protein